RIASAGRVYELALTVDGDSVDAVRVDMGEPIFEASRIPTTLPGNPPTDVAFDLDVGELRITCLSMGNPHCVVYVDELTDDAVVGWGPKIENDVRFPNRVNVEFVQVNGPEDATQRTWERGSGETLACGTGACAVCVAGVLTGRTQRELTVRLRGGELQLEWSESDNHVYMTGPAVEVFSGEWPQ
ncbi:MAG: diaminopimelate epimerase, partial [Planctomycetota bacterium]